MMDSEAWFSPPMQAQAETQRSEFSFFLCLPQGRFDSGIGDVVGTFLLVLLVKTRLVGERTRKA